MNALRTCAKLTINHQRLTLINYTQQRHMKRSLAPVLRALTRRKRALEENTPQRVYPRSSFLEWNRNAELFAFNSRLSEKFDIDLLEQALTQKSYLQSDGNTQDNLQLEEVNLVKLHNYELIREGQQLLSKIVEDYLSRAFPFAPQECVTAFHDYLLSNEILAKTATGIGTKDLILSLEYPPSTETSAEIFYALVGALYRSTNDIVHTGVFVRDILIALLAEKDLMEIWCPEDPMTILNTILDNESRDLVEPRLIGNTGISTLLPVYTVGLYSNKQFLGSGTEETIEEAQRIAALDALRRMFKLLDSSNPIRCDLEVLKELDDGQTNTPIKRWCQSSA